MNTDDHFDCLATTVSGLEPVLAAELGRLGYRTLRPVPGGIPFAADREGLYRANLRLRTANRVTVRVGTLTADGFWALEKFAARLPWERFIRPATPLLLSVTSSKSKLYHTGGIAERVANAIGQRLGAPSDHTLREQDAAPGAARLIVRAFKDRFSLSVDSSGDLLHKRGYRQAGGLAPLRETLAAALLYDCDYDASAPLLDAFCGSGTIPIEAALIARQIAPGLLRDFAFAQWPDFDPRLWVEINEVAQRSIRARSPQPIVGGDRDAGAIARAQANAERAGVADDIDWHTTAFSGLTPPATPGLWLSNLPYGQRTAAADQRNLFAQLGRVVGERYARWQVAWLVGQQAPFRHSGLPLKVVYTLDNGGLPARFVKLSIADEGATPA